MVLENTLESPLDARRSNQSILVWKSVLNIHWKDWCWSWNSNTLATWCEELTHWKRSCCWEWLKVGGEGDDRRWDGWMASPTQWTWVWVNFGSWWWTGRPGMLQSMELAESDMTKRLIWIEPHGDKFDHIWETFHDLFFFSSHGAGRLIPGQGKHLRWYVTPGVNFLINGLRPIYK